MNSRDKGKRGERELAKVLSENGYDCRRGQQFNGADGSADVIGLDGIHIECKRVERLNIYDAMYQSIADARYEYNEIPVVMHRKNKKPWLVTMLLVDWLDMYGERHD